MPSIEMIHSWLITKLAELLSLEPDDDSSNLKGKMRVYELPTEVFGLGGIALFEFLIAGSKKWGSQFRAAEQEGKMVGLR